MSRDYVGVKPCGCRVAWVYEKNDPKDLADTLRDWIKRGLSIERIDTEEARRTLGSCPHKPNPATQQEIAL